MVFQVLSFKINENHTYSNGFPGFLSLEKSWRAHEANVAARTYQDQPLLAIITKRREPIGICVFFNHRHQKTYIFQWFSWYLHIINKKTLHIPMVFQVFLIKIHENHTYSNDFPGFLSPGKSWRTHEANVAARTHQDWP